MTLNSSEKSRGESCSVCYLEHDKQHKGKKYCMEHYQERLAREQLW